MKRSYLKSCSGSIDIIEWNNGDIEIVAVINGISFPLTTFPSESFSDAEDYYSCLSGVHHYLKGLESEGWAFYGLPRYNGELFTVARYDESSEDTWNGMPISGTGGLEYRSIDNNFKVHEL